jgi:periplasmic protein TonB
MEAVQMEVSMSTATEAVEPEVREPVRVWRPPRVSPSPRQALTGPLFADVLLETGGLPRRRRTLATLLSFLLECSLVGVLLLVPLLFTEALPRQQFLSFLVAPPPPPPPPPPTAAAAAVKVVERVGSDIMDGRLRTPSRIPQKVQMIREDEAPPSLSSGGVVGGVPGGIPGGQLGGVIGGIISSTSTLSAVPKLANPISAAPKRIRISQGVTRGSLIQKIEPAYPVIARTARIQGEVVLAAIISKTGEIQNLVLVSGHPMLVPAAIEAVRQWRYRPFLLNGEPVEVDTTITVTFQLSHD